MPNIFIKKVVHNLTGVVSLKPLGGTRHCALLSYDTTPFLQVRGKFSSGHSNQWECFEIARILLERGYAVDVIMWDNKKFIPSQNYTLAIDIHQNLERLAPFLGKKCIKVMHITAGHWLFQNHAEYTRLSALKDRRNVVLVPRRVVPASHNIEHADYAIALGNTVIANPLAQETYGYAGVEISVCPISTTVQFDSPVKKDITACRKNFLWLGGGGMVLKGLDIVLEYFKEHSEYTLTVCGPIKAESDFAELYHQELYETPNIKTLDKVNIAGKEFSDAIDKSIALIFPSASEGQSGSVVTAMHAGLIPLVSRESSVALEPFGITFKSISIDGIDAAIKKLESETDEELSLRAQQAWDYARKHHTREMFTNAYENFIDRILAIHHL